MYHQLPLHDIVLKSWKGARHLTRAATNPWIRFEPDVDLESAVFIVSAIH